MLGDYSYITHVESLLEVLKRGRNVFAMPIDRGIDVDEDIDLGPRRHRRTTRSPRHCPTPTVRYAEGCAITGDDRSGFDAAVEAAAASDVAVMVMGERSGLTDDCTTGESRDVSSLRLPGVQEELVHAVAATGTPVVLVLVAGRPVGSPDVHAAANAVLMAWLPGEQGGRAIADVLTGAASPGGKLPITYPRSSGQIPIFYGHKVSGGRSHWKGSYVDESNEPLYPFGHGLGYSTFTIATEGAAPPSVALDDTVEVSALVTNTGDRRADEVVQLYGRDPMASITRPVRELHGFARVDARCRRLGPRHVRRACVGARVLRTRTHLRRRARRHRVLRRLVVERPRAGGYGRRHRRQADADRAIDNESRDHRQ